MIPLGKTTFGVTVWPVLPGRETGQQTRLAHLTWGGPGDAVHLHAGGTSDGRREYYGAGAGTVSGPCRTPAEAQQAADAYLAGLAPAAAAGNTRGTPAAAGSAQPRAVTEATAPLAADGPDDETARVLAEYGTPEKQLAYALMEAARRRHDANAAALAQCETDASTSWAAPRAEQRYHATRAAARARWAAEAAAAVTRYSGAIGAAAPAAGAAAAGSGSPYARGRSLDLGITRRPDGYAGWQWREYVAGYADGARLRAHDAAAQAEAALNQDRPGDRYTIRFGDLAGSTDLPDLAIDAGGPDPVALQVLQFARDRLPGQDVSVTVEDMRRGRVFAGRKVTGHFTIIPAGQPDEAAAPGQREAAVAGFCRGDLVDYHGQPWTVAAQTPAGADVLLCRTAPGGPPLGDTATAPAGQVRLVTRNVDRTLGKGHDIDHIHRQDRPQDGSAAPGLAGDGLAFTGQAGARVPAGRAARPPGAATSPDPQARPRGLR